MWLTGQNGVTLISGRDGISFLAVLLSLYGKVTAESEILSRYRTVHALSIGRR